MAAAVTPTTGHAARALRLYHEPELVMGFAVSQAWPDEANPPTHPGTHRALGWVGNEVYVGTSLGSANCYARMAHGVAPYVGALTYRLTALSATTYEIRKTSDNTLVGASSYAAGSSENTAVIPGVALVVSSTTMTTGDTYTFRVDGVQGFKACDQVLLVIPDAAGAIDYRGQKWTSVAPEDAARLGVRHVFVSATFAYAELPLGVTYRQVGIFSGLVRHTGVADSVLALLPSQVDDPGLMELVDNRTPVTRVSSLREEYEYLLELVWAFGLVAAGLATTLFSGFGLAS